MKLASKISEETRMKLRLSHLGKLSEGTLKNLRAMAIAKRGVKRTEEVRRKIGAKRSGSRSNFWKGGITPINRAIRNSIEYKIWRQKVFERDQWRCVFCGDHNHKGRGKTLILQADHIQSFAQFPELRFSIQNGRTLCLPCHRKTDSYGGNSRKKHI